MVPEIKRDMFSQRPLKRKSLLGLCADLGPAMLVTGRKARAFCDTRKR